MELRRPNWSDLPPEILSQIAGRVVTKQDVHYFRAVCKSWRFSVSLSSQPPRENLPVLSPMFPLVFPDVPGASDDPLEKGDFFSLISYHNSLHLVANAVYRVHPPKNSDSLKPWLVNVEEFNLGKLYLRLPLSRTTIEGSNLNLAGSDAYLVARGYNIRIPGVDELDEDGILNKDRIVVFSNPDAFLPLTSDNCTAMVLFSQGTLVWARFTRGGDWGYLGGKDGSKFDDIVEFESRVYAIDRSGRLYAVHYESVWPKGRKYYQTLRVDCVVNDPICSGCDSERRKRLVVDSSGVLYLVQRTVYCGEKIHFKVYKLDKMCCNWDEVNSLGDNRVLFVGVDGCFFVSASDFLDYKGNCIIFHKDCFPLYVGTTSDESFFEGGASKELEIGIFHLSDGDAGLISAYPGYSEILWPPPAWLRLGSSP